MNLAKKQKLQAFDEREGRIRLYRDEFEDYISLYASVKMISTCLDKMERLAKTTGDKTWSKLTGGYRLIFKAVT